MKSQEGQTEITSRSVRNHWKVIHKLQGGHNHEDVTQNHKELNRNHKQVKQKLQVLHHKIGVDHTKITI